MGDGQLQNVSLSGDAKVEYAKDGEAVEANLSICTDGCQRFILSDSAQAHIFQLPSPNGSKATAPFTANVPEVELINATSVPVAAAEYAATTWSLLSATARMPKNFFDMIFPSGCFGP
jgi:hypothetical protein